MSTPRDTVELVQQLAREAKAASRLLATADHRQLDLALEQLHALLLSREPEVLAANAQDIAAAEASGLAKPMVDRLRLKSVASMAEGVKAVVTLNNPLGEVLRDWRRPNGLALRKVRVPIGVIAIIYESRPNVTIDAAALCLKTGNAVVLRGGSEAFHTNTVLARLLQEALAAAGLPAHAVCFVPTTNREAVTALCHQEGLVDLIIPRGGHSLIQRVVREARVPVIKHYNGICHVYVHAAADLQMALDITLNAKCQKPSVCNAAETLLVDEAIAPTFLPKAAQALRERGVEMRGCPRTVELVGDLARAASEEDWATEYLDLILSVRVVADLEAAIDHIARYGSAHSDTIVTADARAAELFFRHVDSAAVFWNASTRFNDGFEFGFGAEIGISTDKLHARGPMGLEELTSYKYLVTGSGQVRQ